MKGSNNKTQYDDDLYYRVIEKSLQTIFINPRQNNELVSCANGKIKNVIIDPPSVTIEHECGILSHYKPDTLYLISIGKKIKQGEPIGQIKKDKSNYFKIEIKNVYEKGSKNV